MKKLLLATAAFALIAPAAQAEVKLDLGGYFKGYAGFADQDAAARDFDIKRKSEVIFQGETTLDNGLTVGYRGSMLQQDQADPLSELEESFLYFSGNWGRVNFGRENGVAYLLQVNAPGADSNIDGADIDFSFVNLASGNGALQEYSHKGPQENADKITYITPKFNGFQAGATFSPEVDEKTTDDALTGMSNGSTAADLENLYEAAARYDGEFSGVGVHVGAGYSQADQEIDSTGDFDQWNVGLKLGFENINVGGAYIEQDRETTETAIDTWTVGADYTLGAYTFGANYLESENDANDSFERYTLGAAYTFGPGMKFNGTIGMFDSELAGASSNDGTFVVLGTDVQF